MDTVRDFTTSDSTKQEAAWAELRSLGKDGVSELQRLESQESTSQADRIALAFTLCNLDTDYEAHRKFIVAALVKEPHHENSVAEWTVGLIGRLIRRGDKTLLPVLFSASRWSDGAMTEDLSNISERELANDPDAFLLQLTTVPIDVQKSVYGLIDAQSLTSEDIRRVKNYLRSVPITSSKGRVATELSKKLSELEARSKRKEAGQ